LCIASPVDSRVTVPRTVPPVWALAVIERQSSIAAVRHINSSVAGWRKSRYQLIVNGLEQQINGPIFKPSGLQ
jgi:hypothetical protein